MNFVRYGLLVTVLAFDPASAEACASHLGAGVWADSQPRIAGLDITYAGCPNKYSVARLGVTYYATDEFVYQGITGAFNLKHSGLISPYAGVGLLLGFAEKTVSAEKDNIDNDDDNFIDEPGEERTFRDSNVLLYPQVGVGLQAKNIGFSFSLRKYYGDEFSGDVIYGINLNVPMK